MYFMAYSSEREFDVSEIETLFSAAVPKPNKDKKSDGQKSAPKIETIQLVMVMYFSFFDMHVNTMVSLSKLNCYI